MGSLSLNQDSCREVPAFRLKETEELDLTKEWTQTSPAYGLPVLHACVQG